MGPLVLHLSEICQTSVIIAIPLEAHSYRTNPAARPSRQRHVPHVLEEIYAGWRDG